MVSKRVRLPPGPQGSLLRCLRLACVTATRTVLLAGVLWMPAGQGASTEQRGNCASHGIWVIYEDASEFGIACSAVSDVVGYFKRIDFRVPAKVSVRFANRSDGAKGHSPAHALFDPLRLEIVVYRAGDAKPWGLARSSKLIGSFLRHEVIHTVIWEALKADPKRLKPEWHEFIAYAVQLDLMALEMRQQVLAAHADLGPVKDLSEINEFSYGMHPEGFAVVAYKTYVERGGLSFVHRLLKSEIKPPPMSYPFAVQPHEVRQ